jgi:hypothetical protein
MCFWFGLEILRLVYKKAFFKYLTVSILFDLLSSKKSSTAPEKSKKKFFKIVPKGYQNKQNFALISKMCRNLEFSKREKFFFYRKTDFQIERAQSLIITSSILLIQLFEFGKFGTEQKFL